MKKYNLDHIDIVVSHKCNMHCFCCIDKFRGIVDGEIELSSVENFLKKIRTVTDEKLEVLFLGGEPTIIGAKKNIELANLIRSYGFSPIMSSNGVRKDIINEILPYFDWIQITTHSEKETEYWREVNKKFNNINLKLSGDKQLTYDKLMHFIETTKDFKRRSVSMYFTPNFEQLCKDEKIWDMLKTLDWKINGSYKYAFYKDVRFKKCIPGITNIADEPTVPKLYPNGNYNKTWLNEENDDYLK